MGKSETLHSLENELRFWEEKRVRLGDSERIAEQIAHYKNRIKNYKLYARGNQGTV